MLTMSIDQKKEYLKSYRFAKLEQTIVEEELMELELSRSAPSHLLYSSPHNKSHKDYSQYLSLLDDQILLLQHKRLETIQRYCNIICSPPSFDHLL
ncbi:MAG: hypothetical protein PHS82_08805 [Lachnospiraceae bacterium]|nr:hypothetical protein [Lachnospiraceae bacterium]